MKPHPESKTLIEKEGRRTWRVVERETTRGGLSNEYYRVIEASLPDYGAAKIVFDGLKFN